MSNTIADRVYRDKYKSNRLDIVLRKALVAEKITEADHADVKRIQNPYGSEAAAEVQTISGNYVVDDFTNTDEVLTITEEVIVAEHIYDFESLLTQFDLFNSRLDAQMYSVAERIDRYVLNNLTEDATGAYTTPIGGFTDPVNIHEIISNLASKVMGYADAYRGLFLVVENTDVVGIMEKQMDSGFSYADAALNNGFMRSIGGVDIYVVRTGTFADETLGTTTYTNSGHRVFGVKGVATYASPRGVKFEEKPVSGKTGMEVVTYAYCGFKLWTQKAALVVDITIG